MERFMPPKESLVQSNDASSKEKSALILKNFLYLFLMDTLQIPSCTFQTYESREPGFTNAYLMAFIAAFSDTSKNKLSHELIKRINFLAMSHTIGAENGQYASKFHHFSLGHKHIIESATDFMYSLLYNVSPQGLDQFISFWMLNNPSPIHTLVFHLNTNRTTGYLLQHINGRLYWRETENSIIESFDMKKHRPKILQLLQNKNYTCLITSFRSQEENIQQKIEIQMQHLFDSYERHIQHAKSEYEIIEVIATHIQRITQLHPFMDGNIRTCYILLNKLLKDNGLGLSILMNPNRLDCCHVSEVIDMIYFGQQLFRQLMANNNFETFTVSMKRDFPNFRPHEFTCPANVLGSVEGIDALIEIMLNTVTISPKVTEPTFLQNHSVFRLQLDPRAEFVKVVMRVATNIPTSELPFDKKQEKLEKMRAIGNAHQENKYSLAFRIACSEYLPEIITVMIKLKNQLDIDFNETSSNGNTSLDWLDAESTSCEEKASLRSLMVQLGAKKLGELNQSSQP